MKVNQDAYARAVKALLDGTQSAYDIVDSTGLSIRSAQGLMNSLARHKAVHIVGWNPDSIGRDATPVYALGPGKDVKPRRMSTAEACRQYRVRKKQMAINSMIVKPKEAL